MQIKVYENSHRAEKCRELLEASRLVSRFSEVIILPIPTTRDGVTVNGGDISLLDAVSYADADTLVVGYGVPDEVCEVLSSFGATVCDVSQDEDFLVENAHLTAVAALGIILSGERCAPADLRVGIVGYGRIGRSLAEKLLYLGAEVRVFTRRDKLRMELAESGIGVGSFPLAGAELEGLDLLVNTAPAAVMSECGDEVCSVRIMDLASGAVFPNGARVFRYPSLPARVFPESAGRAFAESVERFLLLGGCYGG